MNTQTNISTHTHFHLNWHNIAIKLKLYSSINSFVTEVRHFRANFSEMSTFSIYSKFHFNKHVIWIWCGGAQSLTSIWISIDNDIINLFYPLCMRTRLWNFEIGAKNTNDLESNVRRVIASISFGIDKPRQFHWKLHGTPVGFIDKRV